MTKKTKSNKEKTLEQKEENNHIFEILDLHSEAIEDGNILFEDIIKRLETLEKNMLK